MKGIWLGIHAIAAISGWRHWVTYTRISHNNTSASTLYLPPDVESQCHLIHTCSSCLLENYILNACFFFLLLLLLLSLPQLFLLLCCLSWYAKATWTNVHLCQALRGLCTYNTNFFIINKSNLLKALLGLLMFPSPGKQEGLGVG